MSAWLPIVMGAAPQFGSEDALAPIGRAHWYHQSITETVALQNGWSPGAATELGWNAMGVDLYAYHPIWRAHGGRRRRRGGRSAKQALEKVHFDNLATTAEIDEVWQRTIGGGIAGLHWAAGRHDVGAARQLIGVALHSMQDFYSHSTWLDAPERREITWLEATGWGARPYEKHLSTGGFGSDARRVEHIHGTTEFTWAAVVRFAAMAVVPLIDRARKREPERKNRVTEQPPRGLRHSAGEGINLDSRWQARVGVQGRKIEMAPRAAFDAALKLAERETANWLAGLEQRMSAEPGTKQFWQRVMREPQGDWTRPYDDLTLRPYDFIAAGHYPPNGTQAADEWFVRVEVLGAPGTIAHLTVAQGEKRALQRWRLPMNEAVTVGPLSRDARTIELSTQGTIELSTQGRRGPAVIAKGHAFRRRTGEVRELFNGLLVPGSGAQYNFFVGIDRDGDRR